MKTIEKSTHLLKMLALAFLVMVSVSACEDDDDSKLPTLNAPTLSDPTEIAKTSMKVTWSAVTGAEKYLLDVSEKADFTTTVSGFTKKEVTTTSISVTGLNAKTKYYARVYAKKGTVTSSSSAAKSATTLEN